MSQHFIKNAFHKIDFGGCPHGIHGCTPVDIMHTVLHGIFVYTKDTFFQLIGVTAVAIIDKIVIALGSQPRCRGRDNYQRVYFGKGISNLTQTTAMENSGGLMMLLFAVQTADGKRAIRSCNEAKGFSRPPTLKDGEKSEYVFLDDYIKLFEMLLCYEQWTRSESVWARDDVETAEAMQEAIKVFLRFLKKTADRQDGQHWSLSKYHEMLHVVWCILRWGPCRNFDTAIGETNHKWLAKKPAKTAQKSLKTFEIQSAGNLFDQYVVSRAMHEFLRIGGMEENFMKFFPADVPKEDLTADDSISDDFQTGRSEFEIEQKYMHGIAYAFYILKPVNNPRMCYNDYSSTVLQFMFKQYLEGYPERDNSHPGYNPQDKDRFYKDKVNAKMDKRHNIRFVSEFVASRSRRYRAHPCYQSRAPWYDWVNVKTSASSFPCQIQMFVEWYCPETKETKTDAIIWRSATQPFGGTVLTDTFMLEFYSSSDHTQGRCTAEEVYLSRYRIVDAKSLQEHLFCFQDIGGIKDRVMRVHPVEHWAQHF